MTTDYPGAIDSFTTKTDGVDQVLAAHVNNLQDSVVAIETALGANLSSLFDAFTVTNGTASAASVGDVGYIDETGDYQTTTTEYSQKNIVVVTTAGAAGASIQVTNKGSAVTVKMNAACSAGDYLYTSTTAGQAKPLSYVRSEVIGVALTANAAGAGGTCTAMLLLGRKWVSDPVSINYFVVGHTDWDFVATINGAPSGTSVVYNAPSSGSETTIEPYNSVSYNYKLVLTNTTRSSDALIEDVNTATNTITLTATVPASWQSGDTITTRSQTATATFAGISKWYELDVEDTIDPLATTLAIHDEFLDSAAAGELHSVGDLQATPAGTIIRNQVTAIYIAGEFFPPINNGRFAMTSTGGAGNTANTAVRQVGYYIATP